MRRIFKVFMSFILILAFSCTTDQIETAEEESLEATSLKHGNGRDKITVEAIECGVFRIISKKRIRGIVYSADGVETEIRPDCDRTYDLHVDDVTDIWVQTRRRGRSRGRGHRHHKSGSYKCSHGEHFTVDDSEFCDEEPPEGCDGDSDCNTGSCVEGQCASIVGGRIFLDANGDGIFNAGESGIVAGVQLQVNVAEGWVDFNFDVSDTSGFYSFNDLNPLFEYRIQVSAPSGVTFIYTTQNGGDDTIDSDVNAEGISDVVQPGPGEADRTVWAGVLAPIVDPPDGTCVIDADCVLLQCGEGGYCTGNVGGRIFTDANGDGIFNSGESGAVAGVYLQVLAPAGWVDFGFEVTDDEGNYMFTALNAGPDSDFEYRIRLIQPPGDPEFVYTLQNAGDDDTIDSDMNPTSGFTDGVNPDPNEVINTLWAGVLPE